MDSPRPPRTQEEISEIMRKVHSTGTSPEVTFREALAAVGLIDELTAVELPGKPDFVLPRYKLVIFIDGDYWHGNQWRLRGLTCLEDQFTKSKPEARAYWLRKIRRNMQRDAMSTATLLNDGWTVLRFWESDVRKRLDDCIGQVVECTSKRPRPSLHSRLPFKSYTELQALTLVEHSQLEDGGWAKSVSTPDEEDSPAESPQETHLVALRSLDHATMGLAITTFTDADSRGIAPDLVRLAQALAASDLPRPPLLVLEYREVAAYNLWETALDPIVVKFNDMGYVVDLLSLRPSLEPNLEGGHLYLLVCMAETLTAETSEEGLPASRRASMPAELVEFITSRSDRRWHFRDLPVHEIADQEECRHVLAWLCTYYLNPVVNEQIRNHALVGAVSAA